MPMGMSWVELFQSATRAKEQTGRGVFSQLLEISQLRKGSGKIFPAEYYQFRLFEPGISMQAKRAYMGKWAKSDIYDVQDPQWFALGNDKLLSYLVFSAYGVPFARVRALYDAERTFPGAVSLNTIDEFTSYLRQGASYPFFAKPSAGYFGQDVCFAHRYEPAEDAIIDMRGRPIAVEEYAEKNYRKHLGGLLLQEVIKPHSELLERIGPAVATARIMTLSNPGEPVVHRAMLRIPTGDSLTDNFNDGQSGSGAAAIDIDTGRLGTVVLGLGLDQEQATDHPDTGRALTGFVLPFWQEILSLVKRAHKSFPGLRIIGWDVAITDEGPVVVELNTTSGYTLLQGHGRGLADTGFRELFPLDAKERRRRYPRIIIGTGGLKSP